MSDFFTTSGDDGTSGLLGKERVTKDHSRLEAVGTIDEANAALGMARAFCQDSQTQEIILTIQRDLYNLMAEVASTPENAARFRLITPERISWLEEMVETIGLKIEMPKEFIVPGDTQAGGAIDLARTVIRRAERRVAYLHHRGEIENSDLLKYLNRLSSLCFVLEIFENQIKGDKPLTRAKG
jgi:cob(I)alamin adenosyltransferase